MRWCITSPRLARKSSGKVVRDAERSSNRTAIANCRNFIAARLTRGGVLPVLDATNWICAVCGDWGIAGWSWNPCIPAFAPFAALIGDTRRSKRPVSVLTIPVRSVARCADRRVLMRFSANRKTGERFTSGGRRTIPVDAARNWFRRV